MKIPVLWFKIEEGNTDVAELRRKLAEVPADFIMSTHKAGLVTGMYFTDPRWLEPDITADDLLDMGCRLPVSREIT